MDTEFKPEELKRLKTSVSNGGYRDLGSAEIMIPTRKAFAEALVSKDAK